MPAIKKLQKNLIAPRNGSIVPNSNPKYRREVENLPLSFISTKNRHEKCCSVLLSCYNECNWKIISHKEPGQGEMSHSESQKSRLRHNELLINNAFVVVFVKNTIWINEILFKKTTLSETNIIHASNHPSIRWF